MKRQSEQSTIEIDVVLENYCLCSLKNLVYVLANSFMMKTNSIDISSHQCAKELFAFHLLFRDKKVNEFHMFQSTYCETKNIANKIYKTN